MANYLKLPTNKEKEYSKDMKINKNKHAKIQKKNQQCKRNKSQKREDANRLNLL
jgi:hypothetical protein